MKRKIVGTLVILLMVFLAACSQAEEETETNEEERVVAVEVAEAKEEDFTVTRSLYGRAVADSTAPVMLETAGEIDTLEVSNGDQVEEDDLIATLATPAGNQNIRAPKDGVIASLQGSEGDVVSNEEPFVVVADMSQMEIEASVTANVRSSLEVDDTITVTIDDTDYEATVESIDMMPDDTALYPISLTIEDEEADILPGAVVELLVPEQRLEDAIIVPSEAIVNEEDETFVYAVEDETAVKHPVTIDETQSEETAIESENVEAGDQIVVTGQLTLSDGDQVNVTGGE